MQLHTGIQESKISNNITLVTYNSPGQNAISIKFCIPCGARHEPDSHHGMAHLVEHGLFKGTKKYTSEQIAEEFDIRGGIVNACTGNEFTQYYCTVLKEDMKKACDILVDMVYCPIFPESEMQNEKKVVCEEIKQYNDDPGDKIFDLIGETAYPNQRFGRGILGTYDSVNSISQQNMLDYVEKYHISGKMLIVITGDIGQHDLMHELLSIKIQEASSQILKHPEVPYMGYETALYKSNYKHDNRDHLDQNHMIVGFNAPGYHSDDKYALIILAKILGGGQKSRLWQEAREKRGLTYCIYSIADLYSDTGMLMTYTCTKPENTGTMIDLIASEFGKVTHNISQIELDRVKKQYISSLRIAEDDPTTKSSMIASSYLKYRLYVTSNDIMQHINNVTLDKIQKIAQCTFIGTNNITLSTIGHHANEFNLDYINLQLRGARDKK